MGNLFSFIFFDISIISFYFFKTEMAVHGGGEGAFSTRVTNDAPDVWCAITSFEKKIKKMLVVAHQWTVQNLSRI